MVKLILEKQENWFLQGKNNYSFFISIERVIPREYRKNIAMMSETFLLTPIVLPVKVGETKIMLRINKTNAVISIFFFIII